MSDTSVEEREELARRILADAPRLSGDHGFNFACHPGVACFNRCCADVNIVLTPLDILRMSRRLEMTSGDFLEKYTFVPFNKEQKLPFVFLKMNNDDKKSCPFVTFKGCSIYQDRPWPCRMYPVGEASPGDAGLKEFFFLMREEHCKGHDQERSWTIREWIEDQGAAAYEEMGRLFRQVLFHPYLKTRTLDPARIEMFYMACYDLDKFRAFVFESRFLQRLVLEPELVEALRSNDMELLRFAFRWLRFALFGEPAIKVNEEMLSAHEREMVARKNT